MNAPVGAVSLVFTDVESSCALWEEHPDAMREALLVHDALLRRVLHERDGYEVKTEGDAFMVAFGHAREALVFCLDVQTSLRDLEWPSAVAAQGGLRVRMGVHTGRPHCEVNPVTRRMDYLGPVVNRAARIAALARGGQIYTCRDTLTEAGDVGSVLFEHGPHALKGISRPVDLVEVAPAWRPITLGPPRTVAAAAPARTGADRDADLLPRAAEALLARGRVRALRGDAEARHDLRLAGDVAHAADRADLRRRAVLALLGIDVDLHAAHVLPSLAALRDEARGASDRYVLARALIAIARLQTSRLEEVVAAEAALGEALGIGEALGDPDIQSNAQLHLGLLQRRTNRLDRARETLERALHAAEAAGTRRSLGQLLNALGNVKAILGDPDEELAGRARDEARHTGSALDHAESTLQCGLHALLADRPTALPMLCEGRAACEALGAATSVWRADLLIALALARQGRDDEARSSIARASAAAGATPLARGAVAFHGAWVHFAARRRDAARADAAAAFEALACVADHPLRDQSAQLVAALDGHAPRAGLAARLLTVLGRG